MYNKSCMCFQYDCNQAPTLSHLVVCRCTHVMDSAELGTTSGTEPVLNMIRVY